MIGVSPYLLVPLLLTITLFQATVLPELTVLGVKPELMLLAVLSWSLLRGPEEGLIWAFSGGLLLDLFSGGPFGASALALLVISFLSAWLEPSVGQTSFLLPMGSALVGTLLYQLIFLLVIQLTRGGVPWIENIFHVVLPSLAINALLMPVVFQGLAWLDRRIGRPMIRW